MQMSSAVAIAVAVSLAFLCGFASHRGSLCAVKAVDQIAKRRRPHLAMSFVRAGLWALLATAALERLFPGAGFSPARFATSGAGAFGAFAFGLGAAINGGCALSTLSRFASGEAAKTATILGFGIGAWGAGLALRAGMLPLPQALPPASMADSGMAEAMLLAALGLCLTLDLLRHTAKPFRRAGWRGLLLARQHRPVLAAAILGIGGGILAWLLGGWSYTTLARMAGLTAAGWHPSGPGIGLLILLFAATGFGSAASAWARGGWQWQEGDSRSWTAALIGGTAMGFGMAAVPGGNDELLLVAFPALSPHALPSYALMLAGIAAVLLWKGRSRSR